MNREIFINEVKNLGVTINDEIIKKLDTYYKFLVEYNSHTNLTAITNEEDVYLKHFYDSLTITKSIDLNTINSLIDIGSGAGFPGIVLKIFYPHINVTVLDSNNKKTKFLSELVDKLSLKETNVINERAEDYAKLHLNEFDLVTSRAVAYVDIITSLALPFVKKDGKITLMKGNFDNEEKVLKLHKEEIGYSNYSVNHFLLYSTEDERNLVTITKDKETSKVLTFNEIKKRNTKWKI